MKFRGCCRSNMPKRPADPSSAGVSGWQFGWQTLMLSCEFFSLHGAAGPESDGSSGLCEAAPRQDAAACRPELMSLVVPVARCPEVVQDEISNGELFGARSAYDHQNGARPRTRRDLANLGLRSTDRSSRHPMLHCLTVWTNRWCARRKLGFGEHHGRAGGRRPVPIIFFAECELLHTRANSGCLRSNGQTATSGEYCHGASSHLC